MTLAYKNIANGLDVSKDVQTELHDLANKYPYCSALQILNFAQNKNATKTEQQLFSLHKGNAFLNSRTVALRSTSEPVHQQEIETEDVVIQEIVSEEVKIALPEVDLPVFEPASAQDFFASQKVTVSQEEVQEYVIEQKKKNEAVSEDADANIMVTRSFNEWLSYFQQQKDKQEREDKDKDKLRGMWQRAKLTAAAEEDNETVPEAVFDKAMSSISQKDDNVSEGLAKVLELQGKYDRAIEIYRKLSLINPEKSAYFAAQIQQLKNKN
jgi:tetratricopeptide (TPR) repeat protein